MARVPSNSLFFSISSLRLERRSADAAIAIPRFRRGLENSPLALLAGCRHSLERPLPHQRRRASLRLRLDGEQ